MRGMARVTTDRLIAWAIGVVEATQRRLPEELRALAVAVPVHYEAEADDDVLAEGFEPDILGLFTGAPYGSELSHDLPEPPQILLYVENLWDVAEGDERAYAREVRTTYLHELGHYFGWDEDDLAERGLE